MWRHCAHNVCVIRDSKNRRLSILALKYFSSRVWSAGHKFLHPCIIYFPCYRNPYTLPLDHYGLNVYTQHRLFTVFEQRQKMSSSRLIWVYVLDVREKRTFGRYGSKEVRFYSYTQRGAKITWHGLHVLKHRVSSHLRDTLYTITSYNVQ
jgi:hypothetical protein